MTSNSTGIGAPVRRVEDQRLLTGQGRFVDDMKIADAAYACVVRSPHAHARIRGIDKSATLAAPGVLAVFTGEDVLRNGFGGLPCGSFPMLPTGSKSHCPTQPILAIEKVRHAGDRVALVVAETLMQAMDALNDREKHILTERRLSEDPKTLEELSQVYDVSRERIRQIEVRAFEKLQKALMNLASERRLLPSLV